MALFERRLTGKLKPVLFKDPERGVPPGGTHKPKQHTVGITPSFLTVLEALKMPPDALEIIRRDHAAELTSHKPFTPKSVHLKALLDVINRPRGNKARNPKQLRELVQSTGRAIVAAEKRRLRGKVPEVSPKSKGATYADLHLMQVHGAITLAELRVLKQEARAQGGVLTLKDPHLGGALKLVRHLEKEINPAAQRDISDLLERIGEIRKSGK